MSDRVSAPTEMLRMAKAVHTLLVDNDPTVLRSLHAALITSDYMVAAAKTATEAIDQIVKQKPVVLDFELPNNDAYACGLRHRDPHRVAVLPVGNLKDDNVRHHVTRSGRKINLTPKEFELLLFMARNAKSPTVLRKRK
jgi:DNA-binding response OmpR family regulator